MLLKRRPDVLWLRPEISLWKDSTYSRSPAIDMSESEISAVTEPNGVTGKLSNWVAGTKFADVPPEIISRAKYLILDGIACALVGAHLPWSETAAHGIFEIEPEGQCPVIGWGNRKLGPVAATLLNSTFVQGFELDDWHSLAPLHSNSLLLPGLLSAIGVTGANGEAPITGKQFLQAYVVGCEVGPRVGLALGGADLLSRGWHSGSLQGSSATAAAVSNLLKLEPRQVEWAFGIACTQSGGLMSAQFGSMAKRMQHGFAARSGLLGALLAKENYTGIEQVFEQSYGGFLSCFSQGALTEPKSRPEELVKGLGSTWQLDGIRIKPHAAMALIHTSIDCIENLQKKHPDSFRSENLENIAHIVVQLSQAAYEHGGWKAPTDKPLSSTGAQMSVQYAAAAQLLDREVLMQQFGAAKLNRSEVYDLMKKIECIHAKEFDANDDTRNKTIVTVRFTDGTELTEDLKAAKGVDPPLDNDEIVTKWRTLVKDVISEERRNAIERHVLDLDQLDDVAELTKLLSGTVKCAIDV